MSTASVGAAFERRVKKHFETDGYLVVRAAASKGVTDLVALKPGQVVFINCKVGGRLDPEEWNYFYGAALYAGAVPVLAFRDGRKLELRRLTWQKKSRGRQPMVPFETDEVAA